MFSERILYAFFTLVSLGFKSPGLEKMPSNMLVRWQTLVSRAGRIRCDPFRVAGRCIAACAALALLTQGGLTHRTNLVTTGHFYLLLLVSMALFYGFWQASLSALPGRGLSGSFLHAASLPPCHNISSKPGCPWSVSLNGSSYQLLIGMGVAQ
jgi:hypothetical protein